MIRNQTNFLMILMIIILTFIPISCSSDHTRLEDHGTYTLVRQETHCCCFIGDKTYGNERGQA